MSPSPGDNCFLVSLERGAVILKRRPEPNAKDTPVLRGYACTAAGRSGGKGSLVRVHEVQKAAPSAFAFRWLVLFSHPARERCFRARVVAHTSTREHGNLSLSNHSPPGMLNVLVLQYVVVSDQTLLSMASCLSRLVELRLESLPFITDGTLQKPRLCARCFE